MILSRYLLSLDLPIYNKDFSIDRSRDEKIATIRKMFDSIIANHSNIKQLVTPQTIAKFEQQYKIYRQGANRCEDETTE